ncbi:hypothetical protein MTO96_028949 [Rhipicephalus appendiculatus]
MVWSNTCKVQPTGHRNPVFVATFPRDGASGQHASAVASCHPFYAGFRIIGRLHRLGGCCFLENIGSTHYGDVRDRRVSRYLLYPLRLVDLPSQ